MFSLPIRGSRGGVHPETKKDLTVVNTTRYITKSITKSITNT